MTKITRKYISRIPCAVLVISLAGCDGVETVTGETSAVEAATVGSPSNLMELAIQTFPGAKCQFEQGGSSIGDIYADDHGIVRFYVDAATVSKPGPSGSSVTCASKDGVMTETKVVDYQTAIATAQSDSARQLTGVLRPALAGDPLMPSQTDLIAAGYPPRPDSRRAPELYRDWLRIVTTPLRRVSGDTVPHQEITNDFRTSGNWSGTVLQQPGEVYMWAQAQWTVPSVSVPSGVLAGDFYSSVWVGLDGWSSGDVVQTGTEQRVFWFGGHFSPTYFYYAWIEWYPSSETGTPLAVGPGDVVYAESWIGRSDGSYDTTGNYCWSYMANLTRGTYYQTSVTKPSGTTFVGDSAEWVVERPTVGGSYAALANYGSVQITSTAAAATDSTYHSYLTDSSHEVWMYNGSTLLSEGGIYGSSGSTWWLQFYWEHY